MSTHAVPLAKLTRPRLYQAVPRQRLFETLDHARAHPIIWLAAPPGSGKTTLIASYLRARRVRSIWYELDSGDGDPATLFHYLSLAIGQLNPKKHSLPLLTAEYLVDIQGFTRRYFREFFARLGLKGILVLDNFQDVSDSSSFQKVIVTALREIPHGVTVVIASRLRPPVALSQLLAERAVEVVESDEIRASSEEARLIASNFGIGEGEILARIVSGAQGWVAGLVLLLDRARKGKPISDAGTSCSSQEVFDYFADQVFEQLPLEARRILVGAALIQRPTGAMLAQLLGIANCDGILSELYERRLFIDRRSDPEPTYVLHSLFRAFLVTKSTELFTPDTLNLFFKQAVELLVESSRLEDAIHLSLESDACDASVKLLCIFAPTSLAQGRDETLRMQINKLPTHILDGDAWLQYWLGMSLVMRNAPEARTHLFRAYAIFTAGHISSGVALSAAGILETHLIEWVHLRELDSAIDILEQATTCSFTELSPDGRARCVGALIWAMTAHRPQHATLPSWVATATVILDGEFEANQKIKLASALLAYYCWTGAFTLAAALIRKIAPVLDGGSVTIPNRAVWGVWLGYHYFYAGDDVGAKSAVDQALDICAHSGLGYLEYLLYRVIACVYLYNHQLQKVDETLVKIQCKLNTSNLRDVAYYEKRVAWLELLKDHPSTARDHAVKGLTAAVNAESPWLRAQCVTTLAQALTDCGEYDAATAYINSLRVDLTGMLNPFFDFSLGLVESYTLLQSGQQERGLQCLRIALSIGREFEFANYFVWSPKTMGRLCSVALENAIEVDYARKLVVGRAVPPPGYSSRKWPWLVEVHTLGKFEVIVDGVPMVYGRKVPKQLLRLLKVLVSFGSVNVPEDKVTDAIWPDLDADAARGALATSLKRLRDRLGHDQVLRLHGGHLSLDPQRCWIDAIAFEQLLNIAEDSSPLVAEEALSLYRGTFLEGESSDSWAFSMRDKLERKYIHHVSRLAAHYASIGRWAEAQRWYILGLESDNLVESFYQGLIRCHMQQRQRSEALSVYRQMRATLSVTLGVTPSRSSIMLYEELIGE